MAYDSSDIHSLGDLEAIRMRPGMYIGDTSDPRQLIIEALDNAVDEVQSGHSEKAVVNVDTRLNLYSVRDYGRGIPHGKSKYRDLMGNENEIETLQLVFTKNHSGGKFGDGSVYKKSRGLHGIGLKAINSLSSHSRAVTFRNGRFVELVMSRGDTIELDYGKIKDNPVNDFDFYDDPKLRPGIHPGCADSSGGVHGIEEDGGSGSGKHSEVDVAEETVTEAPVLHGRGAGVSDNPVSHRMVDDGSDGTYVEFIPDPEIFEDVKIPLQFILNLAGISKAFGSDVEVFVDGVKKDLPYHGLYDLLPEVGQGENIYLTESFHVESPSTESIDVAIRYTSDTNSEYRGYTNTIFNSNRGTHVQFFISCYKEAWEKYQTKGFRPDDVLVGFRAVVGVFISNDQMAFAGQTKERLTTRKAYFEQFRKGLVKKIRRYFDANPDIREGLVKRFEEYRLNQDKLKSKKSLKDNVYVNEDGDSGRVRRKYVAEKLRECTSKSREGTKLLICEGDSAAGAILQARDIRYDAILPLRGKIKNVSKVFAASGEKDPVTLFEKAMENEEVKSIVNSAGTNVGEDCDSSKSRYGAYFIVCDKDADGLNIAALVSALFINMLPDLVKSGMVYVVDPPLYSWVDRGVTKYTSNLDEITDTRNMSRFKGLGEMDPDDIRETFLSPENQRLIQVEYPDDIDAFNEAMTSSAVKYQMLCDMGLVYRDV